MDGSNPYIPSLPDLFLPAPSSATNLPTVPVPVIILAVLPTAVSADTVISPSRPTPQYTPMMAAVQPNMSKGISSPPSATSSRPRARSRVGQLTFHTTHIDPPIPPSLVSSPHLFSPQSIFRQTLTPHVPNKEDEEWLRDTVPADFGATSSPRTATNTPSDPSAHQAGRSDKAEATQKVEGEGRTERADAEKSERGIKRLSSPPPAASPPLVSRSAFRQIR